MTEQGFRRVGNEFSFRTPEEFATNEQIRELAIETLPQMGPKWDIQVPLFLSASSLARTLWLDHVYSLSLDVPGQLVEFGSQWGASLNTFLMLKLIREPWNAGRVINSFSSFSGFVHIHPEDKGISEVGDLGVSDDWSQKLGPLLDAHAARSPIGAENNVRIYDGDAAVTFPAWLAENPEALISHAHFDMDVYQPTKDVLELCLPRMPKGAVLIFDELNCPSFPGETQAVIEALGVHNLALRKSTYQPYSCYCIIDWDRSTR